MNRATLTVFISFLAACSGAAGTNLIADLPPDVPNEEDPGPQKKAAPVSPGDDSGGPDGSKPVPIPDSGADAPADTGGDAAPEEDASVDAPVDSSPDVTDAAPLQCITRGSCRMSATICVEYEDNAVYLQQYKTSCDNGGHVWSFAPCNRDIWVGSCEVVLAGESACPKARYVYSQPVTQGQVTTTCNVKGGKTIFP